MAQKKHGHAWRLPQCPERLGRQPVGQRKDGTQGAHEVSAFHHAPIINDRHCSKFTESSKEVRQRTRTAEKSVRRGQSTR